MNRTTRHGVPDPSRYGFRTVVAALLVAWAFAGPAAAQMARGAIPGTVRDATGALVPGATVTVTNTGTNQAKTAVTDAKGFYRVAGLEPGPYTVRTELAGFSTVESRDIPVRTASEVSLNVELKVGDTTEAITLTGRTEAIELNNTNPTIGLTSTARQAVELPLSAGRSINDRVLRTAKTLNWTAANGRPSHAARRGT